MTKFAILLVLAAAMSADAATVSYEFGGLVRSTTDNVDQFFTVDIGDPVSGSFTVDLSQDTTDTIGKVQYRDSLTDFRISVGDYSFGLDDNSTSIITLINDYDNGQTADLSDQIVIQPRALSGEDITITYAALILRDFGPLTLTDDLSLDAMADIPFIANEGHDLQRLALISVTTREHISFDWLTLERTEFTDDLLPGDANGDGFVNAADLNVIGLNWQSSAGWMGGDFTGDGFVDAADLNALAINWQRTPQAPLSVPEPSALFFVLTAVLAAALVVPWCRTRSQDRM